MELVMTGCLAVSTGCSGVCSTDDCFILDASVFSGTKPRGSNPLTPPKLKFLNISIVSNLYWLLFC